METARPEDFGLSSQRLARIDTHLTRRFIENGKIPGALALVWRRGQLAWCSPLGLMDRERERAMRTDTIFRIYSMTKPITSVALMSLYEEGRFQLTDPVHRFIPEWRDLRVFRAGVWPSFLSDPCERPMTVRDLLTHTSGLTYGFAARTNVDAAYRKLGIGSAGGRFEGTLRDMAQRLAAVPLEFSPGTAWNYSVATDVCGYLVEVISGEPFDAFLQRRIFDPLGMRDTGFSVPSGQLDRFAACYERAPDKSTRLQDDPHKSPYLERPRFLSGGGGLVSTASDYLRFCRMCLAGGALEGERILGRKTLELMTANHLPGGGELADVALGSFSETPYDGVGFGLGFSVTLDPVRGRLSGSPGEYAWGGAASTVFWIDPAEELIAILMTQLMPSTAFNFRGQLKQIVYGAIVD
jgi:CubicO group peptidase (beta-lactamase class C family)